MGAHTESSMQPPSVPLDAIRQPAALFDADGRIVAVNEIAGGMADRPLVGFSADELSVYFDVCSPGGAPVSGAGSLIAQVLGGATFADQPVAITLPDGRRLEILASASPVREGGVVTGALVIWQDVTRSARTEAALRESEQELRSILERSIDAIYRKDLATGRPEYYSPAIEALSGFSVEECLAMSVDDILARVHPEDRQAVFAAKLDTAPERAAGTLDYRFLCRDGTYRWLSDRFRIERDADGRPVSWEGTVRDITDQKQAEAALRESEEKYRALIETNADFVWETDATGRFTYCSPQIERLWGIRPKEMVGRTPFDLMPPDERARALDAFQAAAQTRTGISGMEVVSSDGRGNRIDLEITGVPFFDADGSLLGYRGTTRDVTEQKRAETALLESEERLRLAQESAGIAIWDRDAGSDRVTVAQGFIRRYLLDLAAQASYEDWGRYIHPDDRERVETERHRALAAGDPLDLEFRIAIPSGEVRWLQLKGRGVRDESGALTRVLGVIIDVTDQKRAEEALRESEADARSFFSNMVDACAICEMVVDGSGEPADIRLVDVNPAFERTLSLPAHLIVGQTAFMILPTLYHEWLGLFLEVSQKGVFVAVEEPFPALDRWFHVTGFPVRHGRVAVVFRDITAERRT